MKNLIERIKKYFTKRRLAKEVLILLKSKGVIRSDYRVKLDRPIKSSDKWLDYVTIGSIGLHCWSDEHWAYQRYGFEINTVWAGSEHRDYISPSRFLRYLFYIETEDLKELKTLIESGRNVNRRTITPFIE